MSKGGFVYIMTNKYHTTLYVGVTSDLVSRVIQHREHHSPKSFTARYKCTKLVYYNSFNHIESAIAEEKRLKGGSRQQKLDLIENLNPNWDDLFLNEIQYW
ncbi:GIY-YIG nuclease family protein [Roseivirga sp.]|uniref:GIY-YIG nuclease family protein n=1 Tax=Roseivirga sp. TaxID=1964215 RepID=UPI003B52FB59